MTHVDTGTYGAKVQSWRRANPRDLLKRLIDENPRAKKEKILVELREFLKDGGSEDFLDSIIEYWFSNNYHSLVERSSPNGGNRRAVSSMKRKISARIHAQARIVMLDMLLPNGKKLRDSTGRECAKMGGALKRIGAAVKPAQVIGDVLSEQQVRKIYGGAK